MSTDVERDEGLANERTALAWWRTALAAVVAAGLIVRGAAGVVETVAMGCTAGAALAVLLSVAMRRSRALTAQHRDAPGALTTVPIAAALLVLQVLAVIVIV